MMNWLDTTPEAVDAAWEAHKFEITTDPEDPGLQLYYRLATTDYVQRSVRLSLGLLNGGLDPALVVRSAMMSAIHVGWWVRDHAETGAKVEEVFGMSEAEVEEIRKEIEGGTA
jgi:hypothetical protein